ncbi:MAG TPA: tetratricopeptide repeat protein [Gallionella sp.]|nr:tetratricopeptide repeat protein [Gallionella sp.]
MSLLLEARKKAQSAEASRATAAEGLQPDNQPASATNDSRQNARDAGKNLFNAKSPSAGYMRPNIYLLYALGGTMLMLAAGAGYWWYLDPSAVVAPQRPVAAAPSQPIQTVTGEPHSDETPEAVPAADEVAAEPALPPEPVPAEPLPRQRPAVHVEPRAATVDPLLQNAYLAYRSGKPEEARQLYQAMLAKDGRNTDALLGLAAIAQQNGDNLVAAQYFSRVLILDPRNAVANAGMSALNTEDDGNESRLKTLLREQGDSTALHFALGNLFAGQSRWSEAQQAYFNACTLEPENAGFAYNLAVSLDHLGQADLAARYYRRALQLDAAHGAGFDHAQISRRIEELGRQNR